MITRRWIKAAPVALALFIAACEDYHKTDYHDNTPTSGKLKVYFDGGLEPHVLNQALTFESQYHYAEVEPVRSTEAEAIRALYSGSCEAIFTSRLLNEEEKRLFARQQYDPKYSAVAHSGIAFICSASMPLEAIKVSGLREILSDPLAPVGSSGNQKPVRIVFDQNNSSVMQYMLDSVMNGRTFGPHCSAMGSSEKTIAYVAENVGAIGIIDFAWISDRDDELVKKYSDRVRLLPLKREDNAIVFPGQTSFKTGDYPFKRTIYVMRKTGDFTLAKGFESFVAGPKGQLTFLKQGLLPARQAERRIEIKMEPLGVE